MTRRTFRQCDVERALRATKNNGGGRVIIRPDGFIAIEVAGDGQELLPQSTPAEAPPKPKREIIL